MSVPHALVSELRSICGAEHVPTHRHQLRTYESDGPVELLAPSLRGEG